MRLKGMCFRFFVNDADGSYYVNYYPYHGRAFIGDKAGTFVKGMKLQRRDFGLVRWRELFNVIKSLCPDFRRAYFMYVTPITFIFNDDDILQIFGRINGLDIVYARNNVGCIGVSLEQQGKICRSSEYNVWLNPDKFTLADVLRIKRKLARFMYNSSQQTA
ncbi:MAG: hypothetical protein ABIK73_06940 [candidate division WOR-3 bacterium]